MVEENRFDGDGFLTDISLWSESLARKMAQNEFSIELTDLHMQIIIFVRDFYFKWEAVPMMKTIKTRFMLVNGQLDEMFKHGRSSSRGVICKLGGLPKMLCIASGC
jgi:tRNA 2-thiouridine synthesizing protein E